ncbi:ubiquitin-conjugating enzyme E2 J2-like [Corticium candelabrum]|uniref:ubiquitin-conjugating enzyme E2 J2-like n=1 Tax=Corticium candelabrum TaxID=121492 RepID=UPI002E260EE2|nr:ubiquitin-conjugating enzyme E2 J2-like [Corticium candelabrum]
MTKRISTTASSRLRQDYLRLMRDPVPYITATPLPSNILEWHYTVRGPSESSYAGGIYHGKLVFPREFPFKPPSIYMLTPNGRFKCNTRLCLSISDFHPDTWNPAWSVSTILTGLLSFMLETAPTLGSIESSDYQKRMLAHKSGSFNLRNSTFRELFPNIVKEIEGEIRQRESLSQTDSNLDGSNTLSQHTRSNNPINGFFGNLMVVVAFAVFMYIVRFVLLAVA